MPILEAEPTCATRPGNTVSEKLFGNNAQQNPDSLQRLNVGTEIKWDADYLYFTVREHFPSTTTGATLVFGRVTTETPLQLESQMAENGVIFSDGIEKDSLEFNSGAHATIGLGERKGMLVV